MKKVKASLLGVLVISGAAVAANAYEPVARAVATPDATQMHCISQGGVTHCQVVIDENTGTAEW